MVTLFAPDGRPPYVVFEERPIEDRSATEKTGSPQFISQDWVVVRQVGSKDSFEKPAREWLDSLRHNPAMRPEWVISFKAQYADYKAGTEATPDGLPVRLCPLFTRAQAETLVAAGLRTVEDLAHAPEPALMRIGIDARGMQNRAREWITSAGDTGKVAHELTNVKEENKSLKERVAQLELLFAQLRATSVPRQAGQTQHDDFLGT